MMSTHTPAYTPVRRYVFIVGGACLLATVLGIAIVVSWFGVLPETMATHFGPSGMADGWTGKLAFVATMGSITAGLVILMSGVVLAGRYAEGSRFMLAMLMGTTTLLVGALVQTAWLQRGLADTRTVESPNTHMIVLAGIGLVLGTLTWFALPAPTPDDLAAGDLGTHDVHLRRGQVAVWTGRAAASPWLVALPLLAAGVLVVVAVVAHDWVLLGAGVFAATAVVMSLHINVVVDRHGLRWRSSLGFPRGSIAADDIADVRAIDVVPMQHGGWGFRGIPGRRFAVILRGGEGMEVTKRDGYRFVITVDDARTGAGLLREVAGLGTTAQNPRP